MNILFISNLFPPFAIGGYEIGCKELCDQMSSMGHSISVLTSNISHESETHDHGYRVSRLLRLLSFPPSASVRASSIEKLFCKQNIAFALKEIARHKPDVIVLFNIEGLGALGLVKVLEGIGIPVVLYLMDNVMRGASDDPSALSHFSSIVGLPNLSRLRIISMSKIVLDEFKAELGLPLGDVVLIPGWAKIASPLVEEGREWQDANSCAIDKEASLYCVFISRLAPHKGIYIVLDALAELNRSGERVSLSLCGDGEIASVLQRASALGLGNSVEYHGMQSKEYVMKLMRSSDCLLFPTWQREPFGFVVAEAMANGCVPVLTKGCGASEWLQDGEDCIFIERTRKSLATGIRRLIQLKREGSLERAKVKAMQTAQAKFDIKSVLGDAANEIERSSRLSGLANPEYLPIRIAERLEIASLWDWRLAKW